MMCVERCSLLALPLLAELTRSTCSSYVQRLRSTLRQCVRDWSEDVRIRTIPSFIFSSSLRERD